MIVSRTHLEPRIESYVDDSGYIHSDVPNPALRMTLVCHDLPYPVTHGARVDMWRRIKALHRCGVEIQLICWIDQIPDPVDIAEMQRYIRGCHFIFYRKTRLDFVLRLVDLLTYPLEVTSRLLRGQSLDRLVATVEAFQPAVVWLDGLHGGELAATLSDRLHLPLITRSHNIEHLYYRHLFKAATGVRKIRRLLSMAHLKRFEFSILQKSASFYDISMDDLAFWQQQGLNHGYYLPPLVEWAEPSLMVKSLSGGAFPTYDIVFLGNLFSDNNVAGVTWLITTVLPLVHAILPKATVLIAGSNPLPLIQRLCATQANITLAINPVSAAAVYASGRVLVNPTPAGSGVSIKSIEMLMSRRPIVSTPQGVMGLPPQIKEHIVIATDAAAFADAIAHLLIHASTGTIQPELLQSLFGDEAIAAMVSHIQALVTQTSLDGSTDCSIGRMR